MILIWINMPINKYGVLKGKAIDDINGQGSSPHFQVKVSDDDLFRIAINVKSQEEPSTRALLRRRGFQTSYSQRPGGSTLWLP